MLRQKVSENRERNRGGRPVFLRVAARETINTFTLRMRNMTIFSVTFEKSVGIWQICGFREGTELGPKI
jgi:hypothetical protein